MDAFSLISIQRKVSFFWLSYSGTHCHRVRIVEYRTIIHFLVFSLKQILILFRYAVCYQLMKNMGSAVEFMTVVTDPRDVSVRLAATARELSLVYSHKL
jgi:hypothetical protein